MRRIMLIGRSGCGKTTLVQAINNLDRVHTKTQTVEFHLNMIDTPGEYIENRLFYKALIVTSAECDVIALVQSCTDKECVFPPKFAFVFPKPVIGIITKADSEEVSFPDTVKCLKMSGAHNIYYTSSYTGEGIEAIRKMME